MQQKEDIKQQYSNRQPALGIVHLIMLKALQTFDVYERNNIKGEYLAVLSDWLKNIMALLECIPKIKCLSFYRMKNFKMY